MAQRTIQNGDLLPLGDLTTPQQYMVSELVGDINASIERNYLTTEAVIEVLERLAAILRRANSD